MNKYKIEFTTSNTHIIDVLANTEEEAIKLAERKYNDYLETGILHYYEHDEATRKHTNTFDVTHTDDPFNP